MASKPGVRAFAAATVLLLSVAAADELSSAKFGELPAAAPDASDDHRLFSTYITTSDGTRLAADISVPKTSAESRFPAVLLYTRYGRAHIKPDGARSPAEELSPDTYRTLLREGYAVMVVDQRGTGASFGQFSHSGIRDSQDIYEVIDWVTKQAWSTGKVGMAGGSHVGIMQYLAATKRHPALTAIMPNVAVFDGFGWAQENGFFPGELAGYFRMAALQGAINAPPGAASKLPAPPATEDSDDPGVPAPVDEDTEGKLRDAAVAEHQSAAFPTIMDLYASQYRDGRPNYMHFPSDPTTMINYSTGLGRIAASPVPAYHVGGWRDCLVEGTLRWFANWPSPQQKMLIGPWSHSLYKAEEIDRYYAAELLRWMDYWLKGIDNGIMAEPPIRYAVSDANESTTFRSAVVWPEPAAVKQSFFLASGKSRTVRSVNDGTLVRSSRNAQFAVDRYRVDATTSTGTVLGYSECFGMGPAEPKDYASNDARSLTYTSRELNQDLIIAGHAVARLYVSSNQPNAAVHVYLSEVESNGRSSFITGGRMNAAYRTLGTPPYQNLGAPWPTSYQADVAAAREKPLNASAAELIIPLRAIAYRVKKGSRLRFVIMGADFPTFLPIEAMFDAAGASESQQASSVQTELYVHRSRQQASRVEIPLLPR